MSSKTDFGLACTEISQSLLAVPRPSRRRVRSEIMRVCAKYALDRIPRNYEILATVTGSDFARLQQSLLRKPAKTASGVAVIAIMPKPYACPHGRCTYCPGGQKYNTPNSYTGTEPSTINAIESDYRVDMQILSKLEKLRAYGHDASKLEIVIVGGTFLFMPGEYQRDFIKSIYDTINGFESDTLEESQKNNERADIRNVGLTIETKPDYCKIPHVDAMLQYGATRVEIGVQSLQEQVYRAVNRGHDYNDVTESFQIAKDAGYKIAAHMMPGLPGMTPEQDIADFGRLFSDPDLRPDMLKIYPSLVLRDTPLYDDYVSGRYRPYSDDEMIHVLAEVKKAVPRWVRIMRVQREISSDDIVAGPKSGNLRQIVLERLRQSGQACRCIRCREPRNIDIDSARLGREDYDSSGGREVFLSFDDDYDQVYGFLRLRKPSMPHRREIGADTCIVRELHVYGRSLRIGARERDGIQHMGLGRRLLKAAEEISADELGADELAVISAVGTREYYRKVGYHLRGPYMVKGLRS